MISACELVNDVSDEGTDDGHRIGDTAARAGRVDDEGSLGGTRGHANEASRQGSGRDLFLAAAADRVGEAVDAGDEKRFGGFGGDVAGRDAGAAGREHEAGSVLHGSGDRSTNGVNLVGDDHDRRVDAVIGEEARGERAREVLSEAGRAAVRDRDDACGDHVSDERCRGGARNGARECRK